MVQLNVDELLVFGGFNDDTATEGVVIIITDDEDDDPDCCTRVDDDIVVVVTVRFGLIMKTETWLDKHSSSIVPLVANKTIIAIMIRISNSATMMRNVHNHRLRLLYDDLVNLIDDFGIDRCRRLSVATGPVHPAAAIYSAPLPFS